MDFDGVIVKGSVLIEYFKKRKREFINIMLEDNYGNGITISLKDIKSDLFYECHYEYEYFYICPVKIVNTLEELEN